MRGILLVVTIMLMIAFLVWFYFSWREKSKRITFLTDIVIIAVSVAVVIISVFLRFQTIEAQEKEAVERTEAIQTALREPKVDTVSTNEKIGTKK